MIKEEGKALVLAIFFCVPLCMGVSLSLCLYLVSVCLSLFHSLTKSLPLFYSPNNPPIHPLTSTSIQSSILSFTHQHIHASSHLRTRP